MIARCRHGLCVAMLLAAGVVGAAGCAKPQTPEPPRSESSTAAAAAAPVAGVAGPAAGAGPAAEAVPTADPAPAAAPAIAPPRDLASATRENPLRPQAHVGPSIRDDIGKPVEGPPKLDQLK